MMIFGVAMAQKMKVDVDGQLEFDNSEFTVDEAGENFKSSVESESSMYFSIEANDDYEKKINKNQKWNVSIYKEDYNWNDGLILEARRTGNGTRAQGKRDRIWDGTTYQEITNNSTYFFRGRGEIVDIPISFKLSGVSLEMGAGNFESKIIVTITDKW